MLRMLRPGPPPPPPPPPQGRVRRLPCGVPAARCGWGPLRPCCDPLTALGAGVRTRPAPLPAAGPGPGPGPGRVGDWPQDAAAASVLQRRAGPGHCAREGRRPAGPATGRRRRAITIAATITTTITTTTTTTITVTTTITRQLVHQVDGQPVRRQDALVCRVCAAGRVSLARQVRGPYGVRHRSVVGHLGVMEHVFVFTQ